MKYAITIFTLFIGTFLIFAQKVDWNKINSFDPDESLLKGKKPTQALLLGTFHFNYPGLDTHKTNEENKIDILSTKMQVELKELLYVIKKFKPTKIYVESRNQAFHDSLYNKYKQGAYTLKRNEIYQIGYRLAKELGHKKVYAVDDTSLSGVLGKSLSKEEQNLFQEKLFSGNSNPVNSKLDEIWNSTYLETYDFYDAHTFHLTLLEKFLLMAKSKVLSRMHGHYLTAGFNTHNNQGPDGLAMWWYSRNLRIYNNILKTQPTENDRVLVLFGNGHMSILNECFKASPQFKVISLESLVKR